MGLGKIIIKQLVKVAKDSGKLDEAIDKIKEKVISKGLELVEESGVDSSQLPIDLPQFLRGESPNITFDPTPNNVCAMPSLTPQQAETTIRLVNQAQTQIEKIYETTNNIKSTLLSVQIPINSLSGFVTPIDTTISVIGLTIKTLKLLPAPSAVPPGIGLPLNVFNIFSSTLDSLDKLISIAKANVGMIPPVLKVMTNLINNTITKLNGVEKILNPFLDTLTFVKTVAELRPNCPNVTQEDIGNIKNELRSNIQGNLASLQVISNPNSLSDADLEEQLQSNSDPGFTYKNFKFILEYDPTNKFFFPSRRIRCIRPNSTGFSDGIAGGGSVQIFNINEQTNPNLLAGQDLVEGAYSFSGDLKVLVKEAEFAVDTYTNNITLWKAPQVRENISGSSDSMVDISEYTEVEKKEFEKYYGFIPSPTNQHLPSYIRYGTYLVNLNSSPTDIEYGADRMVSAGSYAYGSGMDISSYIQSGTIQVNKPVNIRLKTFGGIGDPSDGYTTGFTKSLLTIKRSAAIQDDINPFTGRVKGFDQSAIDDFIQEYGRWSIDTLDMLYETFNETTLNQDFYINGQVSNQFGNFSFLERLKYVKDEYFGLSGNRSHDDRPTGIYTVVDELYKKSNDLVNNQQAQNLAWKYFGDNWSLGSGEQTWHYRNAIGNSKLNNVDNWFFAAKKQNYFVLNGPTTWKTTAKAAMLGILYEAGKAFLAIYSDLYGARTDYNDGAWVGAASTLPIIPTQVGGDNEDITISLQSTQLVDRNDTKSEIVGGLSLLGTYTYDLEIIDSLPAAGGSETNYPTNYTEFYIETT